MEPDPKDIEPAISTGLPAKARWLIDGTPLDFNFAITGMLPDYAMRADPAAGDLLVFGEQDFGEGGGAHPWLCVHQRHRRVYGFDIEREEPTFPWGVVGCRGAAAGREADHPPPQRRYPRACHTMAAVNRTALDASQVLVVVCGTSRRPKAKTVFTALPIDPVRQYGNTSYTDGCVCNCLH
jgi:hypothetical protein